MLNCRQASELLSRTHEETLPLGTRVKLRLHVMMCRCCAPLGHNLELLSSAINRQSRKPLDPEKQRKLEATVRQARQKDSKDD
jgi:hypothetical protein